MADIQALQEFHNFLEEQKKVYDKFRNNSYKVKDEGALSGVTQISIIKK